MKNESIKDTSLNPSEEPLIDVIKKEENDEVTKHNNKESERVETEKKEEIRRRIKAEEGSIEKGLLKKSTEGKGESSEKSTEQLLDEVLNHEDSFKNKYSALREIKEEGEYRFVPKGVLNRIEQMVTDLVPVKSKREDFQNDIIQAIQKMLNEGKLPQDFFTGIENMISVGSGHGENPLGLLKKYLPQHAKAIFIDPFAAPSREVSEDIRVVHLGQKFEEVKIINNTGKDILIEASNFLQLFKGNDKKKNLSKIVDLAGNSGKIIIVDEIKRPGLQGQEDRFLNRFYNGWKGDYDRLEEKEYEALFEEAGLQIIAKDNYNRGSVLFVLEVKKNNEV